MTIDEKIKDEKLQYDINKDAAKIELSSGNKIKMNSSQMKIFTFWSR